jgi:hypothetical protein
MFSHCGNIKNSHVKITKGSFEFFWQNLSYFEIYVKLPHLNIAQMEIINSKGFLKKNTNRLGQSSFNAN